MPSLALPGKEIMKKYFLLLPCLALCGLAWARRKLLYALLPPLLEPWVLDLVAATLLLTSLALVIHEIRCPFWLRYRADKTFQQAGLTNSQGQYPVLVSVRSDPNKRHGKLYRVKNFGISPVDFDRHIDRLQTGFGCLIGEIAETENTKYTLLSVLPKRYVKPTLITCKDNAFGSVSVDSLINLLVVGATGTGKTVAIKTVMCKIAKYVPNAVFSTLDFKECEFAELAGLPGYYGYTDCAKGLDHFYNSFKAQQAIGKPSSPHYLVIDEWGAFILSQEKKTAERLKSMLAELLMLGRSYRYIVICGLQRADAAHFPAGARDQFRAIVALGNLSKEQKNMLFPDEKERMTAQNGVGEGYLAIDGKPIEQVKIERVADVGSLDRAIRKAMCGSTNGEAQPKPPAEPLT